MDTPDWSETPLWVFGYGSLLWNPEVPVAESTRARLDGYARGFFMWSIHHRGTEEAPGLVLALDADGGAACEGLGLRVAPGREDESLAALRERELVSAAYQEAWVDLALSDGRRVRAVAYVVDTGHPQYVRLPLEAQARIIAEAAGGRGPNDAYLFNTVAKLGELGIDDPDLDRLATQVRAIKGLVA